MDKIVVPRKKKFLRVAVQIVLKANYVNIVNNQSLILHSRISHVN